MTSESFFIKLQEQYSRGLPFVAYRKPNESLVKAVFQTNDNLIYTSDFTESGFVFAPFDDREAAILIPTSISELIETDYVFSNISEKSNIERFESGLDKEKHIKLVKKGIEAISSGTLKKVVLSRKEIVSLEEEIPLAVFQKLLNLYSSAFTYIWYHPQVGLWLGATPETLLKTTGNRLSTMALAGTQPYAGSIDVTWGSKEREEQQLVVDYILNNLKSSVSDIQASETITLKAGNLLHLKTQISGRLDSSGSIKKLVKSLHPTPAICGLPRAEAKEFILLNEDYNREYYTGFLGELNMKETASRNRNRRNVENSAYSSVKTVNNLYVNLRCMQIIDDEATIYVGGGITKGSIPESEWEETINKANTMKKVL